MAQGSSAPSSSRRRSKNRAGTYAALCVLAGSALSGFLALVSAEAAFLTLGFSLFSGIALLEGRQRRFWEIAQNFRIQHLQDGHDRLEGRLARQDLDIRTMKDQIRTLIQRPQHTSTAFRFSQAPEAQTSLKQPLSGKPFHKRSYNDVFNIETIPNAIVPRALKAGAKPLKSTAAPAENTEFSNAVVQELLHHAIRHQEIEVFAQPIVRLPARQIRFFEMFARLRVKPGVYISARRARDVAAREGLMADIDNLMLLRCLDLLRSAPRADKIPPFFLNIEADTLKNSVFMRQLLPFIARNRDMVSRIVFEIPYAEFMYLERPILKILEGLARLGCVLSLDGLETLPDGRSIDLETLMKYRVRFLKLDRLALMNTEEKSSAIRLKNRLEGNGIGVIATKIETEAQLRDLMDFDPHYGQGYLFGRPDLKGAYMPGVAAKRA